MATLSNLLSASKSRDQFSSSKSRTSLPIHWCGPTDHCWEFLLGHFEDVSILRERDLRSWSNHRHTATVFPEDVLLIASPDRGHPIHDLVAVIEQADREKDRSTSWCVVLGTDWQGHRRTKALPDSWTTFYWHDLHDRMIPWLRSQSAASRDANFAEKEVQSVASNSSRRVSVRVQRLLDSASRISVLDASPIKLAFIIAETQTTRDLWQCLLSNRGISTIAASTLQDPLWCEPSCVIIDLENVPLRILPAESSSTLDRQQDVLRKLTDVYPNALKVVMDSFPRWENWASLLEVGADLIIAKPFNSAGVLEAIELSLQNG